MRASRRVKDLPDGADLRTMAPMGRVRRRIVAALVGGAVAFVLLPNTSALADAGPRPSLLGGDRGADPEALIPQDAAPSAPLLRATSPKITWSDVDGIWSWARTAANFVGEQHTWMRDYPTRSDGTTSFKPGVVETRKYFARAIVRAFAKNEEPDPSITFSDLESTSPFFKYANVAVQHGWMRVRGRAFRPDAGVTTSMASAAFTRVLRLRPAAHALDRLHTKAGRRFETPQNFGAMVLTLRAGLRFNNDANERLDVGPRTHLVRAQVAYSLMKAYMARYDSRYAWVVPYLNDQYNGIELPALDLRMRKIVQWGVRYAGFPYIWAGEWGFPSPEPSGLGGQAVPGFDCSGLTWWAMRRDDGGVWEITPPRPYDAWSLPQRSSADMARYADIRSWSNIRPGDLMFYDFSHDGVVDHVDTYVGRGWALDSSHGPGGVTIMWVGGDSAYHDNWVKARRLFKK